MAKEWKKVTEDENLKKLIEESRYRVYHRDKDAIYYGNVLTFEDGWVHLSSIVAMRKKEATHYETFIPDGITDIFIPPHQILLVEDPKRLDISRAVLMAKKLSTRTSI